MNFKKLALASVIAAMPMSAFALDEITDEALSDVSGQDGIKASLYTGLSGIQTDIYIHDKDGLGSAGFGAPFTGSSAYSFDGAIIIDNMAVGVGGATIIIAIDAGDRATSAADAVLNVNVALPNALTIQTGGIRVGNSQRDNAAWSVDSMSSTILNSMTIILGGTQLNIQLGNEAQTGTMAGSDMIVLNASVTGGISISGFRLNDATTAGDGGMGATTVTMVDNGGANLTMALDINIADTAGDTTNGMIIQLGALGSATGMDIRIVDQYLGTSTNSKIGDISIVGLNLNGASLTINGK